MTTHRSSALPIADKLTVGVIGGGPRAAVLTRSLDSVEQVRVAVVLGDTAMAPAMRIADELGLTATCDPLVFARQSELELVVDTGEDPAAWDAIAATLPDSVEVLRGGACELLFDLLCSHEHRGEQQVLFAELKEAFDRNRVQERRLYASKAELEHSNKVLQQRLSEIYFTHEFFKALTRYSSVNDVCSLIVDGLNGVLGTEISCVYLFNREDWSLRLKAAQGRSELMFAPAVPMSETIVGKAMSEGPLQARIGTEHVASFGWVHEDAGVRSQVAVPLVAGDSTLGVMVLASTTDRWLDAAEMDRLVTLGNQASLSLQNAILLSELEQLSVTDRLTQLYNHGHFHQRLDEEFGRSSRFGHDLSLMMIDIDDFKSFNDRHGHPRGDDALRAVSAVIRVNLRDSDIAARYGGEEFVILLPETDASGARLVADRIREGIEAQKVVVESQALASCTVSIGLASFPAHVPTAAALVESADKALYRAKHRGKNRVEVAS